MNATPLATGTTGTTVTTWILRNGTIRTMSPGHPVAGSIAIAGDTIAALDGSESDAPELDLGGRCVIPGFVDSHVHFLMWSMARRQVRLETCRSLGEAVRTVRMALDERPNDGWLLGHGWRPPDWDVPEEPTRHDLDAISADIPIALRSKDGHSVWVNSVALDRAGGDLATDGGVVVTDDHGEPTGVLRERSAWRFQDRYVVIPQGTYVDAVREGIRAANLRGVTSIHDKDGGLGALAVWQRLREEGSLTIRVWQSFPAEQLDELAGVHLRSGLGDELLRAGYLKAFMDGSLGSQTALMLDGSGVAMHRPDQIHV